MIVEINPGNPAILSVYHGQNYGPGVVGLALLSVVAIGCLTQGGALIPAGFALALCSLWSVGQLLSKRELWCVIDKGTGRIAYVKGGVLGSRYGARSAKYPFAEILALEMERYRRRNTFQLRLVLMGNQTLPLSAKDLELDECQRFVEEVCQFMGAEIPVRVID